MCAKASKGAINLAGNFKFKKRQSFAAMACGDIENNFTRLISTIRGLSYPADIDEQGYLLFKNNC
jgi:hypothetical protein